MAALRPADRLIPQKGWMTRGDAYTHADVLLLQKCRSGNTMKNTPCVVAERGKFKGEMTKETCMCMVVVMKET